MKQKLAMILMMLGVGVGFALFSTQNISAAEKIAFASNRDGNFEIYVMNPHGSGLNRLTNNAAVDNEPSFSAGGGKIAFISNRSGNFEIYRMNPDGSGQVQLTYSLAVDSQPAFSPDGSKIAFRSNRDGNFEVYVMSSTGADVTRLTNNAALDGDPSFSPDGSKITFTSARDGNSEIYVMDADGSNQTRLTNIPSFDSEPSFSSDGRQISFRSERDGNFEIYTMNADGWNQNRLTNNPAFDVEPTFSPNGSKIAFDTNRDGNQEIYVINADGTNKIRLTNNAAIDAHPSWAETDTDGDDVLNYLDNCPTTPNPDRIVFATNRDGNSEIYIMNPDGSNQTRLTDNPSTDTEPSVSKDGSRIAFRSSRDGNSEIYVMNVDGSNQTRVTNNPAEDTDPSFSPDLSKIVFTSLRDNQFGEIYVMNSDGMNQVRLTNTASFDAHPSFSPDGARVVFTSGWEIYVMNANGSNKTNLTNHPEGDQSPSFSPDGTKIVFVSSRNGAFEIYSMNSNGTNQSNLTNNHGINLEPTYSPDGKKIAFAYVTANSEVNVMNADGSNRTSLTNSPSIDGKPSWGSQADSDNDGVGDACEIPTPQITPQPFSVPRASSLNKMIAVVSDAVDLESDLDVSIVGNSSVNGVSLSNLVVDATGNVTADVVTDCSAFEAEFTLQVTNSLNASATAYLVVSATKEIVPPVIAPISNIAVYLPSNSNAVSMAVNFPPPVVSDNCGAVSVFTSRLPGSNFGISTSTVNVTATDPAGNTAASSFTISVLYRFSLSNLIDISLSETELNFVSAGISFQIPFSLSGNKGPNIYSSPPASRQINCADRSPIGPVQAISRTLPDPTYAAAYDIYWTTWNTRVTWPGTCRRLILSLNDGTTRTLDFQFVSSN